MRYMGSEMWALKREMWSDELLAAALKLFGDPSCTTAIGSSAAKTRRCKEEDKNQRYLRVAPQ